MPDGLSDETGPQNEGAHQRYEAPLLVSLGNARDLLAGQTGSVTDGCEGGQQFSGQTPCG
jgi:hypothetical protein